MIRRGSPPPVPDQACPLRKASALKFSIKTTTSPPVRLAVRVLLCCLPISFVGCGGGKGTPAASGSRYVITDVNPTFGPQQPAESSMATALNDLGQVTVVGIRQEGGASGPSQSQSFLYDGSKYVPLHLAEPRALNNKGQAISYDGISQNGVVSGFPFVKASDAFSITFANGINDAGQVVGTSSASVLQTFGPEAQQADVSYPFLYQNGQVARLALFGQAADASAPYLGSASAINNQGQIAGSYFIADPSVVGGRTHAFFYADGQTTDLGTLGGDSSGATALNNRGQAVGYSDVVGSIPTTIRYKPGTPLLDTPPVSSHAALWQNGTVVDMSAPYAGYATAINDQGQAVGFFVPSQYELRAFVYRDGKFHDLNTLLVNSGWTIRTATGINSKGQICGTGIYKGLYHAVLLTPQ